MSEHQATVRLSDLQAKCLEVLMVKSAPDAEMCLSFRTIEVAAELTRKEVRRSVRALHRKGLAEFHKGLRTEDGDFAGAGYCISHEGRVVAGRLFS